MTRQAVNYIVRLGPARGRNATVVPATLAQLMHEGLDRHDAIHAIGSILMGIVFDVLTEKEGAGVDINARYGRELAALTAASWRAQAD
jgi:hypothetical protein